MISRTSLWADEVVRDRTAALVTDRGRAVRQRRRMRIATHRRSRKGFRTVRAVPLLLGGVTLSVGVCAGSAYAYFSTTGSASGDVSTGTILPVTVEHATATVSGVLFPGGTGALALTLTNPNAFGVTVVGVVQDGPVTVVGSGAGCTSGTGSTPGTSGVSVAVSVATGLNLALAAGPSVSSTLVIAAGASMSSNSNTTCQGASFHLPVTVTVDS